MITVRQVMSFVKATKGVDVNVSEIQLNVLAAHVNIMEHAQIK